MSYIVVKTVKGRRYLYEQRTWRVGKRVRTESRYLGPADGGGRPAPARRPRREGMLTKVGKLIAANTLSAEERFRIVDEDAMLREQKAEEAARAKARADFEAMMGVKLGPANPTPQEKESAGSVDHALGMSLMFADRRNESTDPQISAQAKGSCSDPGTLAGADVTQTPTC